MNPLVFPDSTVIGALAGYVSGYAGKDFQPMKANFGIVNTENFPKVRRQSKLQRYQLIAEASLAEIASIAELNKPAEADIPQ